MSWKKESHRHRLAGMGIRTVNKKFKSSGVNRVFDLEKRTIDMRYNPFEDEPIDGDLLNDIPKLFGMDMRKSVVHGTSLEIAIAIKEDGWLRDGTYVHAGFGGFSDAYNWAKNTFEKPVIIMVEVDQEEPLKRGMFGLGWITIGRKGKLSGGTRSDVDKLKIKKMVVFEVPKGKGDDWYGKLEEIKI